MTLTSWKSPDPVFCRKPLLGGLPHDLFMRVKLTYEYITQTSHIRVKPMPWISPLANIPFSPLDITKQAGGGVL